MGKNSYNPFRSMRIVFLISAILFMIGPTLITLIMTFSPGQFFEFPPRSFSGRWYINFFQQDSWMHPAFVSLFIAICSALLALIIGVPAAFWISTSKGKVRAVLYTLFCSPLLIPVVVFATGIYFLFSILHMTDTLAGIIIAHGVLGIPFIVAVTVSSLFSLDRNLELAARNLGASTIQIFYKIKLPLCRIGLIIGFVFAALSSINEVVVVLFLCERKVQPLSLKMWEGFRYEINPTIAVAAIFVMVLASILVLLNMCLGHSLLKKKNIRGDRNEKTNDERQVKT